ncbi:helix-turn-helix domain-containing protein [Nocardia sp. NPDC052566]|uniref:helix-turn-helix domain-containing protein n=1 Tax=Nocardia sp. NPDC052566 TaxID=3364330 RepID=UPI0037C7166D
MARRQLTRLLKQLRRDADMKLDDAAEALEWSESKLSRIEAGKNGLRALDAAAMCNLYGRPDMAEKMGRLAKKANSKSWYAQYTDVIPEWFDLYIGLEGSADQFRWYEDVLVPGMLQTPKYARSLISTGQPNITDAEIDRRVQLRIERQSLLTRDSDPQHWHFALDAPILHRPIGGGQVMADQLTRLLEVADLPNVHLTVVPFSAGMFHGVLSGSFVLLDFPPDDNGEPAEPATVYAEGFTGALYTDQVDEVERYRAAFEATWKAALDPAASRTAIEKAVKEMRKT